MGNFVNYQNAADLMTAVKAKFDALPAGIIPKGSKTFSQLPTTLTADMLGFAYNVSEDFTTTALFVEGAGKKYPAGTNVVIVDNGTAGSPDYKYDVYGNFIDLDEIFAAIDAVSDMITDDEFNTTDTYAVGDIVKKDGILYRFKSAHAAGAWDLTEVDEVNVIDLINSAEPEPLTSAQVNALIALLD